jgi:hypothetical protein
MGIIIGRNWHLTSPRERTINARRLAQAQAEGSFSTLAPEEYDATQAAQKAGEIAAGRSNAVPGEKSFTPTLADMGLTSKDVFGLAKFVMGRKPEAVKSLAAAPISPFAKARSAATTTPKRK